MQTIEMPTKEIRCALLADRHLALAERLRSLLETEFEAVVVVGDEVSLFESARQIDVALAVVDLSLAHGNGLQLIRRIRTQFPQLKLIVLMVLWNQQTATTRLVAEDLFSAAQTRLPS